MTTTTRPLVLSVTEAGNLLGVSRSTAYELVHTGELESVQLRRRVVVPVAVVADRLRVSVPYVWLALDRRGEVAHAEVAVCLRPVPELFIEDATDHVHTELKNLARQAGTPLQQHLQVEHERRKCHPASEEALNAADLSGPPRGSFASPRFWSPLVTL